MVVAMAGGGLVFRLLQVQISCDRACRVSMRSLMKSHWKVRGFRGVLAAWGGVNNTPSASSANAAAALLEPREHQPVLLLHNRHNHSIQNTQ